MRKKLTAVLTCAVMTMGLAACGGSEKDEKATEAKITLGQYKGIEVSESIATITDEEAQDYIDYILKSKEVSNEVKEGTTEKGDSIKATYTATKDGETVNALSAKNSTVVLDDDAFAIDGFVDKLIGKAVGSKVEFDITIQSDFSQEAYRNVTVHYVVTIDALIEKTVPTLTDEWAKENYEYLGITNAEEFKKYYRNNLYINTVYNEVIDDVLANQKIDSYDSKELEEMTKMYREQFESELSYYNIELGAYIQAMKLTEESFNKQMEDKAKEYLKQKMFVMAVVEAENLSMTDDLYKSKMLEMAKSMGLNSQEELESYYNGYMDEEDYKYTIYGEMVQQIICDNVVKVPDKEAETTTAAK